jgi:hypothetical protein
VIDSTSSGLMMLNQNRRNQAFTHINPGNFGFECSGHFRQLMNGSLQPEETRLSATKAPKKTKKTSFFFELVHYDKSRAECLSQANSTLVE